MAFRPDPGLCLPAPLGDRHGCSIVGGPARGGGSPSAEAPGALLDRAVLEGIAGCGPVEIREDPTSPPPVSRAVGDWHITQGVRRAKFVRAQRAAAPPPRPWVHEGAV